MSKKQLTLSNITIQVWYQKFTPPGTPTFEPNKFMEINSEVFGESRKKLKILTLMNQPQLETEMEFQLIYDGTWLWVQQSFKKHPLMEDKKPMISAMKILIESVSPDPIEKPFHAVFGISGMGLIRHQDLPGTFNIFLNEYDFKTVKESDDGKKNVFIGEKLKGQSSMVPANTPKELQNLMETTTKFCTLIVSKSNRLIQEYTLGKAPDFPSKSTNITYVSLNQKFSEGTFKYNIPDGVAVKDITATMKQKQKMMQ